MLVLFVFSLRLGSGKFALRVRGKTVEAGRDLTLRVERRILLTSSSSSSTSEREDEGWA